MWPPRLLCGFSAASAVKSLVARGRPDCHGAFTAEAAEETQSLGSDIFVQLLSLPEPSTALIVQGLRRGWHRSSIVAQRIAVCAGHRVAQNYTITQNYTIA